MASAMNYSPGPPGDESTPRSMVKGPAPNTCASCRKQKRACSKELPRCALCTRMDRPCDYSNTQPPPIPDLQGILGRLAELEAAEHARQSGLHPMSQASSYGQSSYNQPTPYAPSNGSGNGAAGSQNNTWPVSRFPALAFLDRDAFANGGIEVPKPTLLIPPDVIECLGDAPEVQNIIIQYFSETHEWLPIVSKARMSQHNWGSASWLAQPELVLLVLCMKLIRCSPVDGLECSQNPLYITAKRFLAIVEAAGVIHVNILQAGLLLAWWEYGQAIYPAAWLTSGWCGRYATLLGVDKEEQLAQLLPDIQTWTEHEERRRSWWGIVVLDNVISLGVSGSVMSSYQPADGFYLPCNDPAWDSEDAGSAMHSTVGISLNNPSGPLSPFARLCLAAVLTGKVYLNRQTQHPDEATEFANLSELYRQISQLIESIAREAQTSPTFLEHTASWTLACSALYLLYDPYARLSKETLESMTEAAAGMNKTAIQGLKYFSEQIVEFAQRTRDSCAPLQPNEFQTISPIVMNALYRAAKNLRWHQSNGEADYQATAEDLKALLRLMGQRWRNAAEYARILEGMELTSPLAGGA